MKLEEKASGVECEMSEVEQALELITEKEASSDEMAQMESAAKANKSACDRAKAEEMRQKAMESMGKWIYNLLTFTFDILYFTC